MTANEQVQFAIDRMRPFLEADGGGVELVSVEGESALIRFRAHGFPDREAHAAEFGESASTPAISLDDRLREVETNLIRWALKISRGNKSKAAGLLRIKRSTLGDRINRCGLNGRRTPAPPEPGL